MLNYLESLCNMYSPSGNEDTVRDYILKEIGDYCDAKTDPNGNIIAFKKGKKSALKKVMLDAHMDEVGFIITAITEQGFLKFSTVGGIETEALLSSFVTVNGRKGVIGLKPIHLCSEEEKKQLPQKDSLVIDIGAKTKEDALRYVSLGDIGTFISPFQYLSKDVVKAKALDDRFGCSALIKLLKEDSEFDFYATFTVGEEIGLRGATTATYTVNPDFALVLEATTAADIHGSPEDKRVCLMNNGAVISFMDHSTLYPKELFDLAFKTAKEEDIMVQAKNAVAGGNNSGAIHLSRGGVKTLAISLPCRYIHSPNSVASVKDMKAVLSLARALKDRLAKGLVE